VDKDLTSDFDIPFTVENQICWEKKIGWLTPRQIYFMNPIIGWI